MIKKVKKTYIFEKPVAYETVTEEVEEDVIVCDLCEERPPEGYSYVYCSEEDDDGAVVCIPCAPAVIELITKLRRERV